MSTEKRIPRSLSDLDIEILRFLTRFVMVRPHHVAAWTGASPHTIAKRGRRLIERGLVTSWKTDCALRTADGAVRPTLCTVWAATQAVGRVTGTWHVPGTDRRVSMAPARPSRLMTHHTIGVSDLAVWYQTFGYELAAEREILSLERPFTLRVGHEPESFWSTTIPGQTSIHAPDLGAVHPDGSMWAIELERATKSVAEYEGIIRAYRSVGLGQVWHIQTNATARRVMEACTRLGVQWAPQSERGVSASADGLIRLQGWAPGRAGLRGPATWRGLLPITAPGGIPVPAELPDLTATWRLGRVLDAEDTDALLGGVVVA